MTLPSLGDGELRNRNPASAAKGYMTCYLGGGEMGAFDWLHNVSTLPECKPVFLAACPGYLFLLPGSSQTADATGTWRD